MIILCQRVKEGIKGKEKIPAKMVRQYTEGSDPWCLLDMHYRHLESQYAGFDLDLEGEHDDLEKMITHVRQEYTAALEYAIEVFSKALADSDFEIKGFRTQESIFSLNVTPHIKQDERVVYMLADALRFEMGKELAEGLEEEFEVSFSPCIPQLPTITAVGMAALMPGAENGLELVQAQGGKIAVGVVSSVLNDRARPRSRRPTLSL